MITENELILLKIFEKIEKNTMEVCKKILPEEDESEILFADINFKRLEEMEYSLYLNDKYIKLKNLLEMKEALISSPSSGRLRSKKDAITEIEYLIKFLKTNLEQKSKDGDKDYYQFMDKMDDMKMILSLMHHLPEDFDFASVQNFDIYKQYSLPKDLKIDDSILVDRSDEY